MTFQPPSETVLSYAPTAPQGEALPAWLRLANCQFSARLTTALLARFEGDPQAVCAASDAALEEVAGFLPRHLARLRDPALAATERQFAWIERQGVWLVLLGQAEYPRPLREIADPPPILFVRGSLEETDRFGIAIVGSRHATPYGRATAERLARELAGHGLMVVSGGAVGIDTAAHRGALAGGGRTLAALGCGLDVDYPRENRGLFEQIVANGALLSEYPLGAQPEAWRFPQRNRLISGFAQGVLVVEAPRQSGALITATYAAEQGRPVMAVPGNVDRPASEGCNELLKEGANLITCTEDVLRALNILTLPAVRERQPALALEWEAAREASDPAEGSRAREAMDLRQTQAHRAQDTLTRHLPESQRRLMECLSLTPCHIDALAQQAGMTAAQVGMEMTLLELGGFARRLPGNTYIRAL